MLGQMGFTLGEQLQYCAKVYLFLLFSLTGGANI